MLGSEDNHTPWEWHTELQGHVYPDCVVCQYISLVVGFKGWATYMCCCFLGFLLLLLLLLLFFMDKVGQQYTYKSPTSLHTPWILGFLSHGAASQILKLLDPFFFNKEKL